MLYFSLLMALNLHTHQISDLHKHRSPVHSGRPFEEGMNDIQISEIEKIIFHIIQKPVFNPNHRLAAFVVDMPDLEFMSNRQSLILHDLKNGKYFRIRSPRFGHRDFDRPKWANSHILQFDIWTGPSYGIHYILDVKRMRIVWAKHFENEF